MKTLDQLKTDLIKFLSSKNYLGGMISDPHTKKEVTYICLDDKIYSLEFREVHYEEHEKNYDK